MPIDPNDIYDRGAPRTGEVRREQDIDFSALIYEMAEGISEAQLKLDYNTAESAAHFADVTVPVIPRVTRRIDEDGRVTTTAGRREERTLLELGFEPTRYQFSDVRMDIEFDLKLHTDEDEETRLRASTSEAHHNRKFQQDIETTAKLSATLVPVPSPAGLTPAEAYETGPPDEREEEGGDEAGGSDGPGGSGGSAGTGA
jgi:hypothetical protein